MIRLAAVAAAMVLAAGLAHAGERPMMPPSPMIDPNGVKPTTAQPFAQSLNLGGKIYGLADGASFGELAVKIGPLKPGHTGDAGDSYDWLCYTLSDQHMRLWLSAGEGGVLDGVTMQGNSAAPSASCPAPTIKISPVLLDGNLTVGSDVSELKRRLGEPARSDSGWRVYRRSVDLKSAGIDEDDLLVVHVESGKIVFLAAERSATH